MIKLNVQVGDIYGCWRVLRAPEKRDGSSLNYCWCECIHCNKVQKYVRCSDLVHCKTKCLCQRKQRSDVGRIMPVKTMSFYEWCLKNERNDLIDRWDTELNKCNPDAISYQSGRAIYFKCPSGKHTSKPIRLYSVANNGASCDCMECKLEQNSFGSWCMKNDPSILRLWDYELNCCSPFEILKMSNKKFYFKCPRGIHQSSLRAIDKIVTRGYVTPCTYCNSLGQWILDIYGPFGLDMFWDYDNNTKSPFDVPRSADSYKVFIKCVENPEHGSYAITPYNFKKGERCWRCRTENTTSSLQNKVTKYLTETFSYNVLHEYQCSLIAVNPKTNYILPYDNQVVINDDISLIIEVMGEQHYHITGFIKLSAKKHHITPEEELLELQWRDEYKKQYALANGFFYLSIPYWTEDDGLYQQLIQDKIHEILSLL